MTRAAHQISVTIPVLETERLVLREPREADFPAMPAFNDCAQNAFVDGKLERRRVWRGLLANIGLSALRGHGAYSVDTRAGEFVGRVGVICHDGRDEPGRAWHPYAGHEGRGHAHEAALAARAAHHARIAPRPPLSCIDAAHRRSEALARCLGASVERRPNDDKGHHHIYRHPAPEPCE